MTYDSEKNTVIGNKIVRFYQIDDCVMIMDTNRAPGWSAQPIHTR